MQNILVPTDFSETANKAFRFAVRFAAAIKGQITLYHVYTPLESTFVGTEEERDEYNEANRRECVAELERLKAKMTAEAPAVPVAIVVDRTPLTENIKGYAKEHHFNLIIMGTKGASGVKRVLIGSVASEVAEGCDTPVLLIPEEYEWKEPRHFVFASDYSGYEREALEYTMQLAAACNAEVTIVHLCPSDSESEQAELDAFQTFANGLQRKYNSFPLQFKIIPCEELSEAMEHLDEEISYDLLVMVRRHKSLLQRLFSKSFTQTMAYATTWPLLIMPACEA